MKSIVVGYADEAGRTEPKLLCGPEVSDAKQAAVFLNAKRKHQYPDGIVRVEYAFIDEHRTDVAICVSRAIKKGSPVKKLLATIAMAALAFSATAQTYAPQTLFTTNNATALNGSAAISPTWTVVDLRKQKDVALQIDLLPKTTATDAIGFYFVPSVDGLSYATNNGLAIIVTPSGTAGLSKTTVTNLTSWGAGYWALSYVTNYAAASGIITNISVKYGVKISAP